jgi:hypothetical protein
MKPPDLNKAMAKAMALAQRKTRAWAEEIVSEVEASADYAAPWEITRTPRGWTISNPHPQAAVVEYGRARGAKQPPLDAIREWCISKGIDPEYAYPIARAIAEDGIPPRYVLRTVISSVKAKMRRRK